MRPVIYHQSDDRPPQFGLRALFLLITGLCVVFASMAWLGPIWASVLGLFLCLCVAHVAGAVIGGNLRDRAPRPTRGGHRLAPPLPSSRLTERTRISWLTIVATVIGACSGGWLGGTLAIAMYHDRITTGGVSLAIGSGAVLGGFAAFLVSSFLWVAGRAWRERSTTIAGHRRDRERQ